MFRICRTCLKEIQDLNFFTLTNTSTVAIIIKNQLALCVPEMVPEIVSDPVMCHSCVTSLHSAFDFKYQCLQNEERIRNFVVNRTHSSSTGVNLQEMFINIGGEVCTNTFMENTQLVNDFDTLLDIKYEPISIDNNDIRLIDVYTDKEDNFMKHLHIDNIDRPIFNKEPRIISPTVPEGIYTLEKLCSSEEVQLEVNGMFIEQPCSVKVENESSSTSSYNLDSWNNFENSYFSVFYPKGTSYTENGCEENNCQYCKVSPSHTRAIEKITCGEDNESNSPLKKRPRLMQTAKCKRKIQNSSIKRKGGRSKVIKYVKARKSKRLKNIFKCAECDYTTKLQINLELHTISHIKINEDDYKINIDSIDNRPQCSTTYYGNKSGYKYLRLDYKKKNTLESAKDNYEVSKTHGATNFPIEEQIFKVDNKNNECFENVQTLTNPASNNLFFRKNLIQDSQFTDSELKDELFVLDPIEGDNRDHKAQDCLINDCIEKKQIFEGFHSVITNSNSVVDGQIIKNEETGDSKTDYKNIDNITGNLEDSPIEDNTKNSTIQNNQEKRINLNFDEPASERVEPFKNENESYHNKLQDCFIILSDCMEKKQIVDGVHNIITNSNCVVDGQIMKNDDSTELKCYDSIHNPIYTDSSTIHSDQIEWHQHEKRSDGEDNYCKSNNDVYKSLPSQPSLIIDYQSSQTEESADSKTDYINIDNITENLGDSPIEDNTTSSAIQNNQEKRINLNFDESVSEKVEPFRNEKESYRNKVQDCFIILSDCMEKKQIVEGIHNIITNSNSMVDDLIIKNDTSKEPTCYNSLDNAIYKDSTILHDQEKSSNGSPNPIIDYQNSQTEENSDRKTDCKNIDNIIGNGYLEDSPVEDDIKVTSEHNQSFNDNIPTDLTKKATMVTTSDKNNKPYEMGMNEKDNYCKPYNNVYKSQPSQPNPVIDYQNSQTEENSDCKNIDNIRGNGYLEDSPVEDDIKVTPEHNQSFNDNIPNDLTKKATMVTTSDKNNKPYENDPITCNKFVYNNSNEQNELLINSDFPVLEPFRSEEETNKSKSTYNEGNQFSQSEENVSYSSHSTEVNKL